MCKEKIMSPLEDDNYHDSTDTFEYRILYMFIHGISIAVIAVYLNRKTVRCDFILVLFAKTVHFRSSLLDFILGHKNNI